MNHQSQVSWTINDTLTISCSCGWDYETEMGRGLPVREVVRIWEAHLADVTNEPPLSPTQHAATT